MPMVSTWYLSLRTGLSVSSWFFISFMVFMFAASMYVSFFLFFCWWALCFLLLRVVFGVVGCVMLGRHIFAQLFYSLFFDVCFSMVLFMVLFFVLLCFTHR